MSSITEQLYSEDFHEGYHEDIQQTIRNNKEHPFWIPQFGKTYADPRYQQIRLNSDVGCIEYIISGTGVINTAGQTYIVRAGDTYLLQQGKDHNYYSDFNNPMEKIWVNFKGDYATQLIKLFGLNSVHVFRNLDTSFFITEMQRDAVSSGSALAIQQLTEISFLKTIQFLSKNKPIQDFESLSLIEKVRTYIDLHITDNISLKQIAEFFTRNPDYIGRLFNKTYGITPHQYIIKSKIKIAASILSSSNRSAKAVSEMVGFSYVQDFVKHFKKRYGVSPAQYHKNAIEKALKNQQHYPPPKMT